MPPVDTKIGVEGENLRPFVEFAEPHEAGIRERHGAVKDLRLPIPDAQPIKGTVNVVDGDGQSTPLVGVAITTSSLLHELGGYGMGRGSTSSDGQFLAYDTAAGEAFTLNVASPPDTYIASIRQANKDVSDTAIVAASGDPVQVVLRKDGGSVQGTVTDNDGRSRQGFAVLVPKDRRARTKFRSMLSSRDGVFNFKQVAPGDYDLLAFDMNENDRYFDDDYLNAFQRNAVPVQVQPNGTVSSEIDRYTKKATFVRSDSNSDRRWKCQAHG